MSPAPVLVAGAGPTGLVLALSLARRGVPLRLLDKGKGPGERSRAMVVHARTLEFYGQFGFADEVVEAGVKGGGLRLREGGRQVLSVRFDELGGGVSPYPFALAYPQDDHERFLVGKLRAAGVEVEWNAELTGFAEEGDGVRATIRRGGGETEESRASYLCGCDGAHSRVRDVLGVGFTGGTYEQLFFVADVKIDGGFERDLVVNLGEHILALLLPVRSTGMQRLIGLVPPALTDKRELGFEDIRAHVEPLVDVRVTEVNWFSTYRVHHRVAERFRGGRAFLLGDAAHIHSPAGGQGMNTGIGDAINLAWKLAQVWRGRADPALLDTYERERIGFARQLVATTDRAFTRMVAAGVVGELTRQVVAPLLAAVATRFEMGRHALFRTVSQTRIHYADSPLSDGQAGHVHGGDRLPWTGREEDNFAPLRSCEWQVHTYGDGAEALKDACRRRGLPLHGFAWGARARDAGFERDAAYLVRPDGYVAVAAPHRDAAEKIARFADRFGLRF